MAVTAETGSMIFAIINVAIASYCSLFGSMYIIGNLSDLMYRHVPLHYFLSTIPAVIFAMIITLMSLTFAVLLIKGILKKKSQYLKMYYVFGFVKMAVCLFVCAVYLRASGAYCPPFVPWVIFAVYVIYSLILFMIRHTYVLYEAKRDQSNHKPPVADLLA